jgi:hypothetical protein
MRKSTKIEIDNKTILLIEDELLPSVVGEYVWVDLKLYKIEQVCNLFTNLEYMGEKSIALQRQLKVTLNF